MNISGENIIIHKDNNIYTYNFDSIKITGEKIIEMYNNHHNTFKNYFGEHDTLIYYDLLTIYKRTNVFVAFGNIVNFSLLSKLKLTNPNIYEIEKCGFVQSIWGENYYHFLTEELPNIIKLKNYNSSIPLMINYNNKYIKDILSVCNFNENSFIKRDDSNCFKVKEFYFTNMAISGKPARDELLLVQKHLSSILGIDFTPLKNNSLKQIGIYIKRNEHERRVLNNDEIINHLKSNYINIEWIIFESINMLDTIKLFNKASIVISPHGAGLTNMLFCREGITIIEFMPYSDPNECYNHLAQMLNHKYNCIVCEDSGKMNGKQMYIKMEYIDKFLK
jgi:capsular polysaccharide biosynthesis protein